MKIALADKSKTVRSALRLLVEMETDLQVAGEAEDSSGLSRIIEAERPEIMLTDWELPGIEVVLGGNNAKEDGRGTRVIVMANDPSAREQALDAGAGYFVCKGDSPERLLEAINAAILSRSENSMNKGVDASADIHE